MPDYQKGKIYAIRSYQTDDIYIGSTIQSLSVRLGEHKRRYKMWLEGKHNYTSSYEIIKYNDCYVEEIEKCPCNDKNELNRREGQIIRLMDCVNKRIEGRTRKEYRQDNKEKIKEQSKKYREDNRERLREQSRQWREKNRQRHREMSTKYNNENKEKISIRKKKKYQENKEQISIRRKKRYQENKDNILKMLDKRKKDKINCECGSYIRKSDYNKHLKTKKHQTYIQSQSN